MLDIFKLPVYYISFYRKKQLEEYIKERGFKNVNYFQAVVGKKFNIDTLLENSIISGLVYTELLGERKHLHGVPSLGAIGCYMSHYNLWKICVKKKYPYIIIVEDDVCIPKATNEDLKSINNILKPNNSLFISTMILNKNKKVTSFVFTHFYISSIGACKELIKYAFPIEQQLDGYMSYVATRKKIRLNGFNFAYQNILRPSTVQNNIVVKYLLPSDIWYYISMFCLLIIVVIILYINK